ncbi:hypothetical protein J6590_000163 [Homalodisca vitripennis]|nr:hypothetical protein J6590_000163 [Homalodisca vitripennis]
MLHNLKVIADFANDKGRLATVVTASHYNAAQCPLHPVQKYRESEYSSPATVADLTRPIAADQSAIRPPTTHKMAIRTSVDGVELGHEPKRLHNGQDAGEGKQFFGTMIIVTVWPAEGEYCSCWTGVDRHGHPPSCPLVTDSSPARG